MKGTIKANGVSEVHTSIGSVHVHVEGSFGGGTATLEYSNEYGSPKLIANQYQTDYVGRFAGGVGYGTSEMIYLADGTQITVNAVTADPAAPPFVDTFTGANGALTTPWSQVGTEDSVIDTNAAKIVASSNTKIAMSDMGFTGPISNVAVEFDVTGTDVTDSAMLVHFHSSGVQRGIALELYFDATGFYTQIFGPSVVEQGYSTAYPVTFPATFRVQLNGDVLTMSKNGVQFATHTIANGMPTPTEEVGFEGTVGFVTIDNFKFYDLTAVDLNAPPAGVVTEFEVTTPGDETDITVGATYHQVSTSGSGTGFALTPAAANVENTWRPLAGEAYTAAADKFLAIPNGTKVRLSLAGATDPDIFYEVR